MDQGDDGEYTGLDLSEVRAGATVDVEQAMAFAAAHGLRVA